jgi:hypothetical protein
VVLQLLDSRRKVSIFVRDIEQATFQAFQNADTRQLPQLLSDHPANGSRIETLEKHFRDNP